MGKVGPDAEEVSFVLRFCFALAVVVVLLNTSIIIVIVWCLLGFGAVTRGRKSRLRRGWLFLRPSCSLTL